MKSPCRRFAVTLVTRHGVLAAKLRYLELEPCNSPLVVLGDVEVERLHPANEPQATSQK
jgi:hypothetical protein